MGCGNLSEILRKKTNTLRFDIVFPIWIAIWNGIHHFQTHRSVGWRVKRWVQTFGSSSVNSWVPLNSPIHHQVPHSVCHYIFQYICIYYIRYVVFRHTHIPSHTPKRGPYCWFRSKLYVNTSIKFMVKPLCFYAETHYLCKYPRLNP